MVEATRSDAIAAAHVANAGKELFGEHWVTPLAAALNVNERTVRRISAAARDGAGYPAARALIEPLQRMLTQRGLQSLIAADNLNSDRSAMALPAASSTTIAMDDLRSIERLPPDPAASEDDRIAEALLADLRRSEKELLVVYERQIANRSVGFQHFYLFGVARRALAQSRAFKDCVRDRNGLVALALLRLQLDTVLRLYALFWVADPEAFAKAVFGGKQVDQLKAADGCLMKDRYLIDKVSPRNPWIESVYKNTSGLVHFSHRHIQAALSITDRRTGEAQIMIGPNNPSHALGDHREMLEAFLHVNQMIIVSAEDWLVRFDTIGNRHKSD